MTPEAISQTLIAAGLPADYQATAPDPSILTPREALLDVARKLYDDPQFSFDSLLCLSGVDYPTTEGGELEVVYHLFSFQHRHELTLKTRCPKDDPHVPTVCLIWRTAEWHEREAYDLVGVQFDGHPDPRRILLPEDWEGHPLRKDYQPPAFWHEIPVTTQLLEQTDEGN